MSYWFTEFRLKTNVESLVITEPIVEAHPTIAEPVNWSNIDLIGEVDELFHGFNYNYAKGDISLQMTCESASSLIRQQYDRYGVDALVQFLVVEIDRSGTERIVYDGKIKYDKNYREEKGFAFVTVALNSIHEKVTSRWDTKIDLTKYKTLDEVDIIPPPEIEIPLNGQTLHESGQTFIQKKRFESVTFDNPGLGGIFYVLPNMIPPKDDNVAPATTTGVKPALETLKGTHLLYGSVTPINPIDNNPLLDVTNDNAGDYHIEIDWQFIVNVILTKKALQIGKAKFARLRFMTRVMVRIPGLPDNYIFIADTVSADGFVNSVEQGFSAKFSQDFKFPVGSQVYVWCEVAAFTVQETKQIEITVTTANVRVFIDRKTSSVASRSKAYGFSETLRYVFGAVTSAIDNNTGQGRVLGSLLDAASSSQAFDGYAREYAVSSGKQIRGLSKPPSFSLKDLMLFLSAQHVAGILYEKDPITNVETVRIEQGEWFYRGGEILSLSEVYNYSEEPDTDLLCRRVVVGYEKYPTEGPGVGEEFNTERTYQTPLVNSENTLEIKSPLIAAGTAIELQRRLGAKKTVDGVEVSSENDAGTYDDDNFVFHVINQVFHDSVKFIAEAPTPQRPYATNYVQFTGSVISRLANGVTIKKDDILVINGTGTPNDGLSLIVLEVVSGKAFLNPTYRVFYQGFVNSGPFPCTWQIAGQPFKLRTNERLNVVGLTDPTNTVNLELSPARMLRRWGAFINSGLFHKKATQLLRCTEYTGNGAMQTQVKDTEAPLPGDPYRQPVYETRDVALGELQKFNKLFRPELITVKCHMTLDQQRALFDAMQNRGDEEKRNGYVTVKRPTDGVLVSGFLRSITYNKSEEVATMVLRKRRMELDVPTCNYYFDWQLNRFVVDPTANPDSYLFCQFGQLKPV